MIDKKSGEIDLLFDKNGEIVGGDEYQNKEELQNISNKIKNFLVQVKTPKKYTFRAFTEELEDVFNNTQDIRNFLEIYTNEYKKNKNIERIKNFINDIDRFLTRNNSFQIAFVGTVKAGKSTLINAMLKKDYASMNVTPETAVLTKFKYGQEAKMKISFYNKEEWEKLWQSINKSKTDSFKKQYNDHNADSIKADFIGKEDVTEYLSKEKLTEYTSSQSNIHYFVKEVEIEFPEFPYEKNIVFVDTPGLDDALDYRSQVTRNYIKRANAVIVCVTSNALTNSAFKTILQIFDNTGGNPRKVYVVGTQYDNLNNPSEDWEKQKVEWIKHLSSDNKSEYTKYNKELAQKNILPVSAYTALLCELFDKNNLSEKQRENLEQISFKIFKKPDIQETLSKLFEFSNVEAIHTRIKEDILNKVQEGIINDAKNRYKILNKEILEYFEDSKEKLEATYLTSKQGIDAINKKIKEQEQELEEYEKRESIFKESMKTFEKESENILKSLNSEIDKIISKY